MFICLLHIAACISHRHVRCGKSQTELLIFPLPQYLHSSLLQFSQQEIVRPFIAQARVGSEFGTILNSAFSDTPHNNFSSNLIDSTFRIYSESGLCLLRLPLAPPLPTAWWKSVLTDLHVSFLSFAVISSLPNSRGIL